jgi:hypothetical protein
VSAPARVRTEDLQAQQAVELLVGLVREGFHGSVEIHFDHGRPELAKKHVTVHFEKPRDLLRRG